MAYKRDKNLAVILNSNIYIIFLDYGSFGITPFYGVKIGNRVLGHGFSTKKEAKEYLIDLIIGER